MFIKFFISFIFFANAFAVDVVTTLPEFKWVVSNLTSKVEVESLLNGNEDPHFIDATPSFIFKIAKAKLIIRNGLELEDAWLNKVIEQAGNSSIRGNGSCDASKGINPIEKVTNFDRSMGDVHASGNPHYTLSPKRMLKVVDTIADCLKQKFSNLKNLSKNVKLLKTRIANLDKSIVKAKLNKKYYVYHREFSYLKKDYGLNILSSLERIPGVLPSASYLIKIAKQSKKDRPYLVLASNNASEKVLRKFKEMSSTPFKKMKIHPAKNQDYIKFIKNIIDTIK